MLSVRSLHLFTAISKLKCCAARSTCCSTAVSHGSGTLCSAFHGPFCPVCRPAAGFVHSAFTFAHESLLGRSNTVIRSEVPAGALVMFLHKGLQYLQVESHLDEVRCCVLRTRRTACVPPPCASPQQRYSTYVALACLRRITLPALAPLARRFLRWQFHLFRTALKSPAPRPSRSRSHTSAPSSKNQQQVLHVPPPLPSLPPLPLHPRWWLQARPQPLHLLVFPRKARRYLPWRLQPKTLATPTSPCLALMPCSL